MMNGKRKDILTTGQVAQICKVAPRTVTKWFDSGQLKGYRIPGGRDRRIPVSELLRFMKSNNMPFEQLENDKIRVLIVDSSPRLTDGTATELRKMPVYDVETAGSGFDAGLIAQKFAPHVILINLMAGGIDADHICKHIRTNQDLQATKVIAFAEGLKENETAAVLKKGYDFCLTKASDISEIIEAINQVTSVL